MPVCSLGAYAIDQRMPVLSVRDHPLYLFPGVSHFFHFRFVWSYVSRTISFLYRSVETLIDATQIVYYNNRVGVVIRLGQGPLSSLS